ncbi:MULTISPECIES: S41 family peptidase [unclassified Imperialibacter]|uniref:S41 family peptidase n=1 Tax=unclassified Imperialibacter TaxID=2629706 RepID=UPI0012568ABD|nr:MULTISPECIES: S41 family peptidase [unclassified Imperialibacter]CAD5290660.1 C-terminal processing peptidase-3 [Imperialibacter sp. 89]CAD5290929.1 C-terminal processing peptidase-3 [Imperialibacter sp. 75]VVT34440.1 C-terminal processing peptidase-3 [Imperialibacter sp. EC-SDR9]
MSKFQRRLFIPTLLVLAIGWFGFSSYSDKFFQIAKNLDLFASIYKEINTYYVDDVNPNRLIKTGIDAMLESLDPYTVYIPEDDIEDFRTMTTGEYGGIGASTEFLEGHHTIIMLQEGYPAHKAGLQIGDQILSINGIEVEQKESFDLGKLLKGQSRTNFGITVNRYGKKEPMVFQVDREKITIDNVYYSGMVNENIGLIKLTEFTTHAGDEVKKAVIKLKKEGATSIILDLRDNPGGLLHEAVNISNIFLPKGKKIVDTKGKITDLNRTYKTLDEPVDTQIPLAILTNSGSASASEIVAGVIQDFDRGVLIGEKTFGKGLVQSTRPLSYNAQLKVTTAKYYIPSGRCIQALDYAHRNADGTVNKLPDSLKVAFKTGNGRVVYDGDGLDPDVVVEVEDYPSIALVLSSKGYLFQYATLYHYQHPQISAAREFQLSDSDYNDFLSWVRKKELSYETSVDRAYRHLLAAAKRDKTYASLEDQLGSLEEKINALKEKDLTKFKDDIKGLLEQEIITRYYLQKGLIEVTFPDDPDIQKAIQVLNNPAEYKRILG